MLNKEIFESWSVECRAIIDEHSQQNPPTLVYGPSGYGPPLLSGEFVAMNGDAKAELAGDAFQIPQSRKPQPRDMYDYQGRVMQVCKVADRPYGRVVAACLAALEKRFAPIVHIDIDWPSGVFMSRHRWLAPVIEATDTTFPSLIARPGLTLVVYDRAAITYCNYRRLRAAIRRFAKQYRDRVNVVIFDDFMCPETTPQFSPDFVPGIYLHRDGRLIDSQSRYTREQHVQQLVAKYLD